MESVKANNSTVTVEMIRELLRDVPDWNLQAVGEESIKVGYYQNGTWFTVARLDVFEGVEVEKILARLFAAAPAIARYALQLVAENENLRQWKLDSVGLIAEKAMLKLDLEVAQSQLAESEARVVELEERVTELTTRKRPITLKQRG